MRVSRETFIAAALAAFMGVPAIQGRAQTPATEQAAAQTPVTITLDEAIRRAQMNDPNFASAVAQNGAAQAGRTIARSAILPAVVYHNQYIYTQPNGETGTTQGGSTVPKFIANNTVHEYISQGLINETFGLAGVAGYKRAGAAAAQTAAQLEAARRGLVATVVDSYYTLLSADHKLTVMQRAFDEATRFSQLTDKLEAGREVAHADTVKASLQSQQRERDLGDAKLAAQKARLDLGVLLFPDPRTPYTLADAVPADGIGEQTAVPLRSEVEAAAAKNNPDVRGALEAVHVADAEVTVARAGYLPDLGLNYTYGIDAPQFAANGQNGVRNLGYSASATLDIPVWDWLATHAKVKQSELRRTAAKTALSYAQRKLLAQLDELYNEAKTAYEQLVSLQKSVETARESLRLVNLRYRAGESTVLEVVDAQNAVITAESSRADGVVRYRLALANLQTLTGTLY